MAADLKHIYACVTAEEAEQRRTEFEAKWSREYLPIGQSWRRNWPHLIPFLDYPPEIRKVICTTNAIESVNMSLRKQTKNRGAFPSDESLLKFFCLALRNISKKMDDADPRLEGRLEPLYDPVRGTASSAVIRIPVTQDSANAEMTHENSAKVRTLAEVFSRELSAEEITAVSGSMKMGHTCFPLGSTVPTDDEGDLRTGR